MSGSDRFWSGAERTVSFGIAKNTRHHPLRSSESAAMKTCLIVIDAQESFRQRSYWNQALADAYLAQQNTLIEGCAASGVPIVRVFHTDAPSDAGNPFAVESGHVRPLHGPGARSTQPPPLPSTATARWSTAGWTCGSHRTASAGWS
jgi:hypothetical protein